MYTMLMKDLSKDFLITTLSQNNLNLRVKTCHGFLVLLMHRHMSVSVQDMCKKKPDMSCCIRSSLLGLFFVRRRFSFGTVCRKVNALFRKLSGGIKWTSRSALDPAASARLTSLTNLPEETAAVIFRAVSVETAGGPVTLCRTVRVYT